MKWLFLLCALLIAAPATAQMYTYQFSGHVDYYSPAFSNLVPGIQNGQLFTGWFSYSSEPYNSDGMTEQDASFSFTLGEFSFSHINDYTLLDVVNHSFDQFSLNTYGTQGDLDYLRTGVSFMDFSGTAFNTDDILPESLSLSMFSPEASVLNFNGTDAGGMMTGILDTLVMVPEPASMVLLLFGGLLLRYKR